ncbi:polysaccharide deacetylase family protein [Pelomonas sp. V22]|uniref:polysaccharide deacetylase family protein n=1 Tax=Pelomonas sp. V22 TaxID=2822139 RepID=UPI0024A9D6ED|nr:polysaccharide deacetylase family protein [Pelomonas sp. V22]MDI4634659.1 polysaccharide deacetylase family protein [Pelomonas sp. V22]
MRGLGLPALLAALISTAAGAEPAQPFAWPNGARAAVSLSYDDALASQLDHALPALDGLNLKASFYLTLASETVVKRLPEWRAAAARGHELGNHSLYHPCSRSKPGRDWVAPHRDLDKISVAAQREELLLANSFLQAIDGRTERTLTTPCGDLLAAGQPYLPAVKGVFIGVKSRTGGVVEDIARLDPEDVGTADPTDATAERLISLVDEAAARGTMVSITFHGVGGDYLSVSKEAHAALLRHLKAHPERFWVDSFVNIMRWVRARRSP